jgi:hypothetical protein
MFGLDVNGMMRQPKKLFAAAVEPFRFENRFNIGLVLVFLMLNGLVLINACLHDPSIGYDADGYLGYVRALSQLRLVTPQDTHEFFSPPLPYAIPALLIAFTGMKVLWAAKLAQLLNVILSVGLTLYLIKACQLFSSRSSLKLGTLVFLGILPAYYKTFAFVRGEPYVAFFAVVILYYTLRMSVREQFTAANGMILGVAMGLCALSRQWGILLFPSVFLLFVFQWIRLPRLRYSITRTLCLCLVFIIIISGWFYMSLHFRYGSSIAFARKPAEKFSFSNQPLEFYVGLSPRLLFDKPVRPNFPNQFLPIFYSELWGDYWCFFTVYGRDSRNQRFINGYSRYHMLPQGSRPYWFETNYETIGAYLGRVNLVSTFPSVLALASLLIAAMGIVQRRSNDSLIGHRKKINAFLLLAIGTTMVGYFWFLIMYPSIGKGRTIKATYVLQVFPLIAILVGFFLEHVKKRSQFLYRLILGGLCFSFFHNIFAMLTHYQRLL